MCWFATALPTSIGMGCLPPPLVDVLRVLCVDIDVVVTPLSLWEGLFELEKGDPSIPYPDFIHLVSTV